MDVIDAMYARQTIGKVKPDSLPRELIEKLLAAGVQAPNHYKVRPWRFVVLTGSGRENLGDEMAAIQKEHQPNLPPEAYAKTRAMPLRAPLVIAVAADKPGDTQAIEIENICATSAACQNILLAAHAEGLGGIWRTGTWAREPRVKEYLGFEADQHVIGFLYIGYPEVTPERKERPSFEDRTVWMD